MSVDTCTPGHSEQLDRTFAALANPIRRAILHRLSVGEASVTDLAEPFPMSLAAVSRHIRVLEQAGLVTQGRRAQYRPCTLDPTPLAALSAWTEQYRPIWEARLDRLDDHIRSLDDTDTPHPPQTPPGEGPPAP